MAYVLAWICISPMVLGADGLKLLPGRNHSFVFLTLGAFAGPTLSAWTVTYLTRGKTGIQNLLRGYVRWKTGILWYAISLLGFPLTYLAATSVVNGGAALAIILSLFEPLTLTLPVLFGTPSGLQLTWLVRVLPVFILAYILNLGQAVAFRRYGFLASYSMQFGEYMMWHILYGNVIYPFLFH